LSIADACLSPPETIMIAHTIRLLVLSCLVAAVFSACSDAPRHGALAPEDAASLAAQAAGGAGLDAALDAALTAAGGRDAFVLPHAGQLRRIPQDPRNPLTRAKVELGRLLYHETALAVDNVLPEGRETYSCASCHHAQGGFAANLPQGIGEGGSGFANGGNARTFAPGYDEAVHAPDCQPIRSPTVLNSAYQELMLWNGQFGGVGANLGTEDRWTPGTPLESNFQGLHGLETQVHAGLGVHRMLDLAGSRASVIARYRALFRAAFPGEAEPLNRLNCSLAVAAYERTVLSDRAPFQAWLRGNRSALTEQEKRGAVLFFGKAGCVDCHTGPALNSMSFHALGMNDLDGSWDPGRVNLGPFGGTVPDAMRRGRGGFTGRTEDMYAFKTPQLYNLLDSPYYGHGASFATVRAVIEYKNAGVAQNPVVPAERLDPEFVPLGLDVQEIADLTAFIEGGLYDPSLMRHVPQRVPSGNCFPVNDPQSRIDLGCGTGR
jgi:cytochrome c peroxidase